MSSVDRLLYLVDNYRLLYVSLYLYSTLLCVVGFSYDTLAVVKYC